MSLNRWESESYAIAESVVLCAPVDGIMACANYLGCGLMPSAGFISFRAKWGPFIPANFGVDLCEVCGGTGRA